MRSIIWVKDKDTSITDYIPKRFPSKLLISLSSKCNLSCKHCGRSHFPLPAGSFMQKEMINNIIKDFFPGITALQLGGSDFGEQMLSPHFSYLLEHAKNHTIDIDMVTNGTLINSANAMLIAQTMSRIIISVEGLFRNYEKVRGFKWKRFARNIDLLVNARKKIQRKKPLLIVLQFCIIREFKDDYFELLEFAKENKTDMVVARNFIPCIDQERESSFLNFPEEHNVFFEKFEKYAKELELETSIPSPLLPEKPVAASTDNNATPQSTSEANSTTQHVPLPPPRDKATINSNSTSTSSPGITDSRINLTNPPESKRKCGPYIKSCSMPFEVFGIEVDGKIIPCCESDFNLGYYKAGYENVMERWNSDNFVAIRKTVNSGYPMPLCRKCEVGY